MLFFSNCQGQEKRHFEAFAESPQACPSLASLCPSVCSVVLASYPTLGAPCETQAWPYSGMNTSNWHYCCYTQKHPFPDKRCSFWEREKGRFAGRSFCLRKGTKRGAPWGRECGKLVSEKALSSAGWGTLAEGTWTQEPRLPTHNTLSLGRPLTYSRRPGNSLQTRGNKSALSRRGKPGFHYEQLVNQ